jgi:hypothetical protein
VAFVQPVLASLSKIFEYRRDKISATGIAHESSAADKFNT